MISHPAKDSIERIFYKAAQTRLPLHAGDACTITPLAPEAALASGLGTGGYLGGGAAPPDPQVVVLTISSILFRLMLVLNFDTGEATRGYFLKDEAQGAFPEVYAELANLCCGAMNQELLNYFPDLGMSTPYVLSARCVPHLENLKPAYLGGFEIVVGASARITATLCVCAHGPIDFVADVSAHEESSGELELF